MGTLLESGSASKYTSREKVPHRDTLTVLMVRFPRDMIIMGLAMYLLLLYHSVSPELGLTVPSVVELTVRVKVQCALWYDIYEGLREERSLLFLNDGSDPMILLVHRATRVYRHDMIHSMGHFSKEKRINSGTFLMEVLLF